MARREISPEEARALAAIVGRDAPPRRRGRPRAVREGLDARSRRRPGRRGAAAHDRGGLAPPRVLQRARDPRHAAGRAHGHVGRRARGLRRARPRARPDDVHPRDRHGQLRRGRRAGRRDADAAGSRRGEGPLLPAGSGLARLVHDRRQRRRERGRAARRQVRRHGALGDGPRGGLRGRLGRRDGRQDAQGRRGLRPHVAPRRERGDARRRHEGVAAPHREARGRGDGPRAVPVAGVRREGRLRDPPARPRAVGVRGRRQAHGRGRVEEEGRPRAVPRGGSAAPPRFRRRRGGGRRARGHGRGRGAPRVRGPRRRARGRRAAPPRALGRAPRDRRGDPRARRLVRAGPRGAALGARRARDGRAAPGRRGASDGVRLRARGGRQPPRAPPARRERRVRRGGGRGRHGRRSSRRSWRSAGRSRASTASA